jgi:hypothetical protein
MAIVQMDLVEVDKLRDTIKGQLETIKQKDLEIARIEADKRVVEITKTVEVHPEVCVRLRSGVGKTVVDALKSVSSGTDRNSFPMGSFSHHNIFDQYDVIIRDVIKPFISLDNAEQSAFKMWSDAKRRMVVGTVKALSFPKPDQSKTDYRNFEDVVVELRSQIEGQVAEELGVLKSKNSELRKKLAELEENHRAETGQANNNFQKELSSLREKHSKELEEQGDEWAKEFLQVDEDKKVWEKRYYDLKEERDTRSKEQQYEDTIAELKTELAKAQRPWYKKLFS